MWHVRDWIFFSSLSLRSSSPSGEYFADDRRASEKEKESSGEGPVFPFFFSLSFLPLLLIQSRMGLPSGCENFTEDRAGPLPSPPPPYPSPPYSRTSRSAMKWDHRKKPGPFSLSLPPLFFFSPPHKNEVYMRKRPSRFFFFSFSYFLRSLFCDAPASVGWVPPGRLGNWCKRAPFLSPPPLLFLFSFSPV